MKKKILILSVFTLATMVGAQLKAEAGNLTDEAAYNNYYKRMMKESSQNTPAVKNPVQAKSALEKKQEQASNCIIL